MITKFDFTFTQAGFGKYWVSYRDPKTGKKSGNLVTDMELIDATKNSDSPKVKDLNQLKRACKR